MRRRLALIGAVVLAAALVTLLLGRDRDPGPPPALVPGAGNTASTVDPLAWDPGRYGEQDIPYAQLFFDSTPLRHAAAWRRLAVLGDDSSTYLWRVLAAREIMRLYRDDPERLARQELLQTRKPSAEDVLHPPDRTQLFADPLAVRRARAAGELQPLTRKRLRRFGLRIAPTMGQLAGRRR